MSLLSAETSVSLSDPLSIVDAFEDHFSEHMEMEREGATVRQLQRRERPFRRKGQLHFRTYIDVGKGDGSRAYR